MRSPADKILVIVTNRLGDVLLTTPLIRSVRRAYPNAVLHALVYDEASGILEGNPDIDAVIPFSPRPTSAESFAILRRIWRAYDLALTSQAGDRPVLYSILAGKSRFAVIPGDCSRSRWKRWFVTGAAPIDTVSLHTVLQNLQLADLLEIPRCYDVVVPRVADDVHVLNRILPMDWQQEAYVLLHPSPKFRYKYWTVKGWRALTEYLYDKGVKVVITASGDRNELAYVRDVAAEIKARTINLAGQLTLAELSTLARHAALFVGTDTVITHIAAAVGTPTVALFGPSRPLVWGPWPKGYSEDRSPYVNHQPMQRVGNVLLLQGIGACVPCNLEGCERHIESLSDCLQFMPASRVISAAETMLQWGQELNKTKHAARP